MGSDKIKVRYLLFKDGAWRWRPTKKMRAAGFAILKLGPGYVVEGKRYPDAADIKRAMEINAEWDRHRRGLPPLAPRPKYPHGSLGDGYERAMRLREQERKAKGIVWTREQYSRDDWPRAWKWIEPLLGGDSDPRRITPEMLIGDPSKPNAPGLRPLVAARVSEGEAFRVIKVWRALWQKMGSFGYCDPNRDPSFLFANSAPHPRQAVWSEGEAVRLIKQAWRSKYPGLAALLATAWDSQLSPIDARKLKAEQRRRDIVGTWFQTDRTKTGREAFATLSPRAEAVLDGYLASLAAEPIGPAPIFRNRSGGRYTKDVLAKDFRAVRTAVFGEGETRQLQDFRRSGTVEALAGKVAPSELSSKMANSIGTSNCLHKTYGPVQLAAVRDADAARRRGRNRLREQRAAESVRAPAQKCPAGTKGDS
jgi:hypothetical protein